MRRNGMYIGLLSILLAGAISPHIAAQVSPPAPELAYDSAPNLLKMPVDIYLGEAAGVATNSKGQLYVYSRTGNPTAVMGASRIFTHGGSRLFVFDRNGNFTHEIGQGIYGFLCPDFPQGTGGRGGCKRRSQKSAPWRLACPFRLPPRNAPL